MLSSERPRFVHRLNRDGSHDSICTNCVATVASVLNEWQLRDLESVHVCDPVNLYRANPGQAQELGG